MLLQTKLGTMADEHPLDREQQAEKQESGVQSDQSALVERPQLAYFRSLLQFLPPETIECKREGVYTRSSPLELTARCCV